jgi:hypothetical protein
MCSAEVCAVHAGWMGFVRGLEGFAAEKQERRHPHYRGYIDDSVLCSGYFVFSLTSADGETQTQSGRESYSLVRIHGRWLVANLHLSEPF